MLQIGGVASLSKVRTIAPGDRVILTNAMFPLHEALSPGYVELRDGRIADMGRGAPPPGAGDQEIIDVGGKYVTPGLIDAHVHMNGDHSLDPNVRYLGLRNTARSIRAAQDAQLVLAAGFTTVRTMGHSNPEIVYGLREAIDQGWILGPHMLFAGWTLSQTGGHGNWRWWPYELVELLKPRAAFADGEVELRKLVRRNFREGADFIKLYATEGLITATPKFRNKPNFTVDEIRIVAEEAHARGLKVAAHATSVEGARRAVLAGVDTIEHGPPEPNQELAELMAERGAFLVPTPLLAYSTLSRRNETKLSDGMVRAIEEERDGQRSFMQQAMAAGVKIALGSDTFARPPLGHLGQNAKVLELLVEWGCTPRQALEAATSNAAEAMGYAGKVGTLERGAYADVLVWDLNPLDNVSKLKDPASLVHVFRSGLLLYG